MTDQECICRGNWRAIVRDNEANIERRYCSYDSKEFTFFGIVHTNEDYYYGMFDKANGLRLLSCVGSIEGHGYTLKP